MSVENFELSQSLHKNLPFPSPVSHRLITGARFQHCSPCVLLPGSSMWISWQVRWLSQRHLAVCSLALPTASTTRRRKSSSWPSSWVTSPGRGFWSTCPSPSVCSTRMTIAPSSGCPCTSATSRRGKHPPPPTCKYRWGGVYHSLDYPGSMRWQPSHPPGDLMLCQCGHQGDFTLE